VSDPVLVALIAAVPAALAAIAAIQSGRAHGATRNMAKTLVKVQLELNGRLGELLKATNAQGRQDERDDQAGKKDKPIEPGANWG